MPAIRILVVDGSVVIRKVLAEALAADASIEVAGTAAALTFDRHPLELLRPDRAPVTLTPLPLKAAVLRDLGAHLAPEPIAEALRQQRRRRERCFLICPCTG